MVVVMVVVVVGGGPAMVPVGSPGAAGGVLSASSTVTGSAMADGAATTKTINREIMLYFSCTFMCCPIFLLRYPGTASA